MAGQAFYNQMVLVDPADAARNTVYIGGQLSAARSTDGGGNVAHHQQLAGAVQAALRPRRSSRGGLCQPQGRAGDRSSAPTAACSSAPTAGDSFSSQKNDGISSYLIYALSGNPMHPDDVFIGLQDDGSRWRVGKSGTYNQVLGGDGFGAAWSQATDDVGLASVYYSFIVRT